MNASRENARLAKEKFERALSDNDDQEQLDAIGFVRDFLIAVEQGLPPESAFPKTGEEHRKDVAEAARRGFYSK